MVVLEVVEGTTTRLTFQLYDDGVAIDGTGLTVTELLLTGKDGTPVDTSGNVGWATQASGTVYYDPDAADLVANRSPYRIRWKLTDGSSKVRFYPSGAADALHVLPAR